jgi:hypothetical protein
MTDQLVLFYLLEAVDHMKRVYDSRYGAFRPFLKCACCFTIYEHFKHIKDKYENRHIIEIDDFEIIDVQPEKWEII